MLNWKVYLDANDNGVWDAGEDYRWTAGDGSYVFRNVSDGLHTVRVVGQDGWVETCPSGTDYYTASIADGGMLTNINFGEQRQPLVVSTLVDENDGNYSDGHLSLRKALSLAAQPPGDGVIQFKSTLSGGTITLDPSLARC